MFRNTPIRQKLMAVSLLTSGVVLLLTCAAFVTYEIVTLRTGMIQGYTTRAQIIAANSTAALAFQNESDAASVLAALKMDKRIMVAGIYDNQGKFFAKFPATAAPGLFPARPGKSGYRNGHLEIFCPVIEGDRMLGTVFLQSDLSALTSRYRAYAWLSAFIVTCSILVAYLLSRTLQKQISQPILALAETAKAISERRDYSVRARKFGADELGLLTDAFNQMLADIGEQEHALREENTERKQAEDRLKASLKEVNDLKAALDEHAIVAITDAQGKITYVNDKFCAISKYSRAELLGQDHRLINSGHHSKKFIRDLWTTIARGQVWHGEIKNRAKDGSFYWVDTTIVPFLNDDGKPRQYVAIRADITGRKRAQEEAAREQARFRLIFESTPVGIAYAIVQPDGQYQRIINDAHLRICGLTREQDKSPGIYQRLVHPEDALRQQKLADELLGPDRTGKISLEKRFVKLDGEVVWVAFTFQRRKCADGNYEELTTVVDINDLKNAEAEIRQLNAELEQRVARRTVELEAANKELEAFSYSVSHDLRAPLRAVNGFAGIVLDDFGPLLPDAGRNYLERIRNGGQRMGELIDDLLAFSRLSRLAMNRQPVNSMRIVQESLDELKPLLEDRQIELRIGELPTCQGDPLLLKQVWINLLSNAIKYSRDRAPAIVEVGCTRDDGENVYFVRDNGVGFDMQYVGKLFGVFQRLHRADEFEGTGVGLAIVQRIIHRHGGRVWAEAQLNHGATFYFTIEGENQP